MDQAKANRAGTLLDSDANLLLLGDGSLICNNCTYSCNACGNKIEDLAILTGDQAFCSACFRCRNCKRKIENLRYARTSQGIFCMSCHESLMARRRKKSSKTPKPAQNGSAAPKEKALPSLPPGAAPLSAFSPEVETPPSEPHSGTPGARSPPERPYYPQRQPSSRNPGSKRDVSPLSDDARRGGFTCAQWLPHATMADRMTVDGPTLPASTYGQRRASNASQDSNDGEDSGFLPMAFDPNPVAPPPIARKAVPRPSGSSPSANDGRPPPDYFTRAPKSAAREVRREEDRTRSVSTEREPEKSIPSSKQSPHIFSQDKGRPRKRETSGNNTPQSSSATASPLVANVQDKTKTQQVETGSVPINQNEGFRLQEVPKSKKASSRSNSKHESPSLVSPMSPRLSGEGSTKEARSDIAMSNSPVSLNSQHSSINPFDDPKRREGGGGSAPAPPRPVRGDSLAPGAHKMKANTSPEPASPAVAKKANSVHGRQESASSAAFVDAKSTLSRSDDSGAKTVESPQPMRASFDAVPPRSSSRPTAQSKALEDFTAPRAPPPPPPPPAVVHKTNDSISTLQSNEARSEDQVSPALRSSGLPKHSMDGPFSMEYELSRILQGSGKERQATEGATSSMMRKVSNAVKHGRSFSDRGLHSAGKSSSSNGARDIGSPMMISSPLLASPTGKESYDDMATQLRRARARIAELEAENGALETKMNSSTEIKAANHELREKRDTIVVLNTQREVVVRELEAMTDQLAKAKENNQPLNLTSVKTELLQDFGQSLEKLKEDMSAEIEDLMHKRNQLNDEISKLIQMKDKGFQEYETLSNKNAQLQEMNNQIMATMQDTYKANRAPNGQANGLGIYHPYPPKSSEGASEVRNLNLVSTDSSLPNLLQETEAEPATILTAPQVVNIRKGQPKKFNWRKGGERMAKNVTKGIKGAFVSGERREGDSPYGNISVPYATTQQPAFLGSDQSSLSGRQGSDAGRPGAPGFGGLFGQKGPGSGLKPNPLGMHMNGSMTNLTQAADPSGEFPVHTQQHTLANVMIAVLFGSELELRCEYEKRVIPAIVSRCIEEVEARGMDMEGVYRKSGGSGQVKTVQLGFEKDGNYDISDPDLDIHAVTSALKQYFRKLPTPLITYDVYELLLAAGREDKASGAQTAAFRVAVAELPERHRDCLEFLMGHLSRVVEMEGENLMTPLNLAVVFAPTIMRPLSIEREMSDMQTQRVAVQALLENCVAVFEGLD